MRNSVSLCSVVMGGEVSSRQRINLPTANLFTPAHTNDSVVESQRSGLDTNYALGISTGSNMLQELRSVNP
jgi:hypothetical protein